MKTCTKSRGNLTKWIVYRHVFMTLGCVVLCYIIFPYVTELPFECFNMKIINALKGAFQKTPEEKAINQKFPLNNKNNSSIVLLSCTRFDRMNILNQKYHSAFKCKSIFFLFIPNLTWIFVNFLDCLFIFLRFMYYKNSICIKSY